MWSGLHLRARARTRTCEAIALALQPRLGSDLVVHAKRWDRWAMPGWVRIGYRGTLDDSDIAWAARVADLVSHRLEVLDHSLLPSPVVLLVAPAQVEPQPSQPLVAAAGSSATGAVVLAPRDWGTSIELTVSGLPRAGSYVAWIEDPAGARSAVAWWGPTDDGRAMVTGATALDPEAVRRVIIETDDGQRLLRSTR